jgi:hypothetical protein
MCCFRLAEARRRQSPCLKCSAIKGYKSNSFTCAVARIRVESTRRALRVLLYLFARDEAIGQLGAG